LSADVLSADVLSADVLFADDCVSIGLRRESARVRGRASFSATDVVSSGDTFLCSTC
jgi:hypothetical protein